MLFCNYVFLPLLSYYFAFVNRFYKNFHAFVLKHVLLTLTIFGHYYILKLSKVLNIDIVYLLHPDDKYGDADESE
jgi:hypothetical protein